MALDPKLVALWMASFPADQERAITTLLTDPNIGGAVFGSFPFVLAGGSNSNIALNSGGQLPFYLASGSASNVAVL